MVLAQEQQSPGYLVVQSQVACRKEKLKYVVGGTALVAGTGLVRLETPTRVGARTTSARFKLGREYLAQPFTDCLQTFHRHRACILPCQ